MANLHLANGSTPDRRSAGDDWPAYRRILTPPVALIAHEVPFTKRFTCHFKSLLRIFRRVKAQMESRLALLGPPDAALLRYKKKKKKNPKLDRARWEAPCGQDGERTITLVPRLLQTLSSGSPPSASGDGTRAVCSGRLSEPNPGERQFSCTRRRSPKHLPYGCRFLPRRASTTDALSNAV